MHLICAIADIGYTMLRDILHRRGIAKNVHFNIDIFADSGKA